MTLDLSHVINAARIALMNLYKPGMPNTFGAVSLSRTVFLGFEPLGRGVPPEMFRLTPSNPTLSPALATEHLSYLANSIPAVNVQTIVPTGTTIDSSYDLILAGAQPLLTTTADAVTLFQRIKAEATELFDNTKLSSILTPLTTFHPVFAEPANWYDPAASSNWTALHFEASPPSPQPIRPPPPHRWPVRDPPPPPPDPHHPRLMASMDILEPDGPPKAWEWQVVAEEQRPDLAALREARLETPAAVTAVNLTETTDSVETMPTPATASVIASPLHPALNALVSGAIRVPPDSASFELRFEACAVALDRPWLDWAFLETRDWYVPGFREGDFAPGGIWPAISIGMILVRKLVIQARGCPDDSAAHAVGFGPFSLLDARSAVANSGQGLFDVTLSAEGPQIIAWIGQALTDLPPKTDPSLTHA